MTALPIVCDNCGAKYKLPPSFSSPKAKCKQCGSVIDVAAQREAAPADDDAPARARPAKAQPAKARPARTRAARTGASDGDDPGSARARPARAPSRRSRRGAEGDDDGGSGGGTGRRSRRGREREEAEPKKSNMPLIAGSIGGLAVIAVIVVLLLNSGDEPETDRQANQQGNPPAEGQADPKASGSEPEQGQSAEGQSAEGQPAGDQPSGQQGQPAEQAGDPAEAGATPGEGEPKAATGGNEPDRPDPAGDRPDPAGEQPRGGEPAEELPPDAPRWMHSSIQSMDQVFDPSTLPEVSWPESAPADKPAEIAGMLDDIEGGGLSGIRAKPKLVEEGHLAVFGMIERLRQVDYANSEQNMFAYELNKLLEEITTLNTGFAVVGIDEDLDPRKADWNAKTTKAWYGLVDKDYMQDAESFEAWRKKQAKK